MESSDAPPTRAPSISSSSSSDWARCQTIIPELRMRKSGFSWPPPFIEPAKKASPKRVDEHLNPAYCESMVHTCVPQPCQDVLLLCFSHRACCLRSSSPQLRRRRRRRMRRPRNNQQIRTRLRAMNRCAQLRYSRPRDNRRQASPGSNRQPLPKLARVGKQRHGRSSETLALRTERLLASRRSAFWG